MGNEYNKLYEAIFMLAVADDVKLVKQTIYSELTNIGTPKNEAHKHITSCTDYIVNRVKQNVYAEATKYPNSSKSEAYRNNKKLANQIIEQYRKNIA